MGSPERRVSANVRAEEGAKETDMRADGGEGQPQEVEEELPDAEEESVALVDTKVLEEEEKLREQRKKEEDANQPTVRAPAPRLFRPIPPRVGRGHVAGAGAHPVSVPTTPRATFATSLAPLARTSTSARDDARDRSRARPARAPRPRSPTLRSPNFSKLARWRALAWTAGF